jgi:hypothetical protein
MAQAREHSVVIFMRVFSYLDHAGSGCPRALLRVPRAARSSFTYAKHTGIPLLRWCDV